MLRNPFIQITLPYHFVVLLGRSAEERRVSETSALESKVTELEALLKVKTAAVVGTGSGSGSGSQSPGHGQVMGMITVGDRDGEGITAYGMQGNHITS